MSRSPPALPTMAGLIGCLSFRQPTISSNRRPHHLGNGPARHTATRGPNSIGTGEFPTKAVQFCLDDGYLDQSSIDFVAHAFNYERFRQHFQVSDHHTKKFEQVFAPTHQLELLQQRFPLLAMNAQFVSVEHHLAHAASAFYPSGFEDALILVADGMGEIHATTIAIGSQTGIEVLKSLPASNSLGLLYGIFTLYLGFLIDMDEYKVMGLSAYGDRDRYFNAIMDEIQLNPDGTFSVAWLHYDNSIAETETHSGVLDAIARKLGPPRNPREEIIQRHRDIAASLQAVLETCLIHLLRAFRGQAGRTNLCMAGGVALNCVANATIKRSGLFRSMFVQPAAGDDGTALGAALHVHRNESLNPYAPKRMGLPLWGPEFNDDEILSELKKHQDLHVDRFSAPADLIDEVAERLAAGQVVAWFHGRMEFGPRALGSRSILADPRESGMRDRINDAIKKRESFRPFAPVVTSEAACDYFELSSDELDEFAFMIITAPVSPEKRDCLAATTHVDGSARVQVLKRDHNPLLWQLLRRFGKLTDVPILLNTSFNIAGEPIVCTPSDATRTFRNSELDVLSIGSFLVSRADQPH